MATDLPLAAGRKAAAGHRYATVGSIGSPIHLSCARDILQMASVDQADIKASRSSISYSGIQYTPVASIATVSIPQAFSHSALLLFIVISTNVMIRLTMLQHNVDNAGQLVGCGSDRGRRSQTRAHTAIISAQGTVTVLQGGSRYPQGSAGAVLGWLDAGLDHFSAGNLVVWTQDAARKKNALRLATRSYRCRSRSILSWTVSSSTPSTWVRSTPSYGTELETDQNMPGSFDAFVSETQAVACRVLQVVRIPGTELPVQHRKPASCSS